MKYLCPIPDPLHEVPVFPPMLLSCNTGMLLPIEGEGGGVIATVAGCAIATQG